MRSFSGKFRKDDNGRRPVLRVVLSTLLVGGLLGSAVIAGWSYVESRSSAPVTLATSSWDVGACHRFEQPEELRWDLLSDGRSPVNCRGVHETETYKVAQIGGELAARKERPSPVLLRDVGLGLCEGGERDEFIGKDQHDAVRGFRTYQFYPSAEEWSKGDRRVRCDLAAEGDGPQPGLPPRLSYALKDVLARPEGSRFRVCRLDNADITCDQPHDRELVNPWLVFGPDQLARGHEFITEVAANLCTPGVEAYVGSALASRPDLRMTVEVPGDPTQRRDSRVGRCWVGPADPGANLSSSLRGAGRSPGERSAGAGGGR